MVAGCKVNQVEAGLLGQQFLAAGWLAARAGERADLVLVHTCTVTQRADRDSRKAVQRAQQENPGAAIAVSGCLAEMEAEAVAAWPGVKAVIRQADRGRAAEIVHAALLKTDSDEKHRSVTGCAPGDGFFQAGPGAQPAPLQQRTRAFIKIEDGCDGACTYCRVRLARGKPVSRPLDDILAEAQQAVGQGFRELVITGVNLGCWRPGLDVLIGELSGLAGDFRFRLSSLEPQHVRPELVATLEEAGGKICPHLHLAVQSGDDAILKAMGRSYTVQEFRRKVMDLRERLPHFSLTADVITGFPGETLEQYERTRRLLEELCFSRLHVFTFSGRPGTPAAALPGQIISREKIRRARELRAFSARLALAYRRSLLHARAMVLLERRINAREWFGITETYEKARVATDGPAGRLVPALITGADKDGLLAKFEN